MAKPSPWQQRFVDSLVDLDRRDERAALAALRRGLGKEPGAAAEMHRYVVRWLPKDVNPWEEDVWYLVASLFALHPRDWPTDEEHPRRTNFGASFARFKQDDADTSVERRFVALLNCHQDNLADHLRHAVGLLKTHEAPVDWAQLLNDIRLWGHEANFVQRDWARSFWAPTAREVDDDTAATATIAGAS